MGNYISHSCCFLFSYWNNPNIFKEMFITSKQVWKYIFMLNSTEISTKIKFLFLMHFYIIRKMPEFCSVYEYQNFQINLGIFKISFQYFLENSKIINKFLCNCKSIKKIQNWKALQNSGIFQIFLWKCFAKRNLPLMEEVWVETLIVIFHLYILLNLIFFDRTNNIF